jgi:hypothetical protein
MFLLDVLVEFLIRMAINALRKARSRSWSVTFATVKEACLEKGHTGGCRLAVVKYGYRIDGERYSGTYKEPFLIGGLAEDYVRGFPSESETPIRTDPADPSKSVLVRG